jgi:hypothetical protein
MSAVNCVDKLCRPISSRTRKPTKSYDSSVGIATSYGLGDRGIRVRVLVGPSRPALGPTQPHILWVLGNISPGVKRPGREADHSVPTTAEVKKI